MNKKLRNLLFLKFFSVKTKLILSLVFVLILAIIFSHNYLQTVKADNLLYSEDFSTIAKKDSDKTSTKWLVGDNKTRLWGREWVNAAVTNFGYENISVSGGTSSSPIISMGSDNNPYVVWEENQEIYFSHWNADTGWSAMNGTAGAENISNTAGISHSPRLVLDSNNNPLITWTDIIGGSAVLVRKWNSATTSWTNMKGNGLYDVFSGGDDSYIDLDANNNPYLVWESGSGVLFTKWDPSGCSGSGCWVKMNGDSGQEVVISSQLHPIIKLDSANNPYILSWTFARISFIKWSSGVGEDVCGPGIVNCWTNMKGDLMGDELITSTPADYHYRMVLNSNDEAYLVWEDMIDGGSDKDIYFSYGIPGTGWQTMAGGTGGGGTVGEDISQNTGFSYNPDIALDSTNKPYIVWDDDTTGNKEIYFVKWTGSNWRNIKNNAAFDNISNTVGVVSILPKIKIIDNIPYVAWQDGSEIFFSKGLVSTGWTKLDDITLGAENISNNPTGSSRVVIADDSNKNLGMVWEDNNEVLFTRVIPYYQLSAQAISTNVKPLGDVDFVTSIKFVPTETKPANTSINYYISNNGGTDWQQLTPLQIGNWINLNTQGTDLLWRADLTTNDKTKTPFIDDLNITYQTQKLFCGLSPRSTIVGGQIAIEATTSFSASSVWATVEKEGDLLTTVAMPNAGGNDWQGNYTVTNNNFGQNDVAVFATDGTDTYVCNPSTGASWLKKSISDIPWKERRKFGAVSFNGYMWVLGGYANMPANDVWRSKDGLNWEQITDNAPWSKRIEQSVIVFDNKIWVMGGFELVSGVGVPKNDVWNSTNGVTWNQVTNTALWSARSSFGIGVYNNELWLIGGCIAYDVNSQCTNTSDQVWHSPDGGSWSCLFGSGCTYATGLTSRASTEVITYNPGDLRGERLWAMGGIRYLGPGLFSSYNDVWSWAVGETSWTLEKTAAPWKPRHAHQVVKYDNGSGEKMWLLGGYVKYCTAGPLINQSCSQNSDCGVGFSCVGANRNDVWSSTDGQTWDCEVGITGETASCGKYVDLTPPLVSLPNTWPHWTARNFFRALSFNNGTGNKLWLLGGTATSNRRSANNEIWQSSNGQDWTLLGQNPSNQQYDAPFDTRFDSQIFSFDEDGVGPEPEKLWLIGGLRRQDIWVSEDGINWTCFLGNYSLATNGFTCTNNIAPPWPAIWGHKVLVYNNKVYIIGGCSATNSPVCPALNQIMNVWESSDLLNWTTYANALPNYRLWRSGVVADPDGAGPITERMWLIGGATEAGYIGQTNVLWSTNGSAWTVGPALPSGRYAAEAVAFNDGNGKKIYLAGGVTVYPNRLNDVLTFNGTTWTTITPPSGASWTKRYALELLNYDDKLWVFGGNDINYPPVLNTNNVWWSKDGISWNQATNWANWDGRDFFTATVFKNKLWLVGGDTNMGTSNEVWASDYDYSNMNFTVISTNSTSVPSPVSNFSCQALGTDTITWQFTDSGSTATGYRLYEPTPSGGAGTVVLEVLGSNLNHINSNNLLVNKQYSGYVVPFNQMGESTGSDIKKCFTWANTPLQLENLGQTADSITLKINPADNNPDYTKYAIYEAVNNKYVQADGTFADNEVWQTYNEWGGDLGIEIVGGQVLVQAQYKISLDLNQPYSFAVKAKNGDNIETPLSLALNIGEPIPIPPPANQVQIIASKFVGISVAKNDNILLSLSPALGAAAATNTEQKDNNYLIILQQVAFVIFFTVILAVIFLFLGLKNTLKHLGQNKAWPQKIKLLWLALIKEPAHIFEKYLKIGDHSGYNISFSLYKNLHLSNQKYFRRVVGLGILDLLILGLLLINFNHSGIAQVDYNQNNQPVAVGEKLNYKIEYSNAGSQDANDVIINDTLDPNLNYVAGSGQINSGSGETGIGVSANGQIISFNLGQIKAGDSGYVLLNAQVMVNSEGAVISNQAKFDGSNFATVMTNFTYNQVKTSAILPICGNGLVEAGESCDQTSCGSQKQCVNCQCQTIVPVLCGNGVIDSGEQCDQSSCAINQTCTNCQCQEIPPINTNTNTNQPPEPPIPPTPPTPPIPPTPPSPPTEEEPVLQNSFLEFLQVNIWDNKQVEKTSQNIITPLLLTIALLNLISAVPLLLLHILPFLHLLFTEPFLWLFKKRREKWGVVYDALSKIPVDLAVVRLYAKADNRLIQTRVTDRDGRYLILVKEPGQYYLSVVKPGFQYPTRYLAQDKEDLKYLDLYHGEELTVSAKQTSITPNIPLDPVEKKLLADKQVIRTYLLKNIRLIVSYVGIILALLIVLLYPTIITIGALIGHVLLFALFRRLSVPAKPKSWGIVYDESNKEPLKQAIVRIFDIKFNKLLETQVTDGKGRYAFLVGQNDYQLLSEKEGYQKKEVKPVDLIQQEQIINLDIGLRKNI